MTELQIALPASLQNQLDVYLQIFLKAKQRLEKFASEYQWLESCQQSWITEMCVFDQKPAFDQAVINLFGLSQSETIPSTYVAIIEHDQLLIVTPELYWEIYPDGREDLAYEKLICHELAHRLHIRLLNGDEDRMGPMWFFEGFATLAADQFSGQAIQVTFSDIEAVWNQTQRGSYRVYNQIIKYCLQFATLPQLLEQASESNFENWLRSLIRH